jgi:hypothetical protein
VFELTYHLPHSLGRRALSERGYVTVEPGSDLNAPRALVNATSISPLRITPLVIKRSFFCFRVPRTLG